MPKQDIEKYHQLLKNHKYIEMYVLLDDYIERAYIKYEEDIKQYFYVDGMNFIWCKEEDLFFDLEEAKKQIISDFTNKINAIKF